MPDTDASIGRAMQATFFKSASWFLAVVLMLTVGVVVAVIFIIFRILRGISRMLFG